MYIQQLVDDYNDVIDLLKGALKKKDEHILDMFESSVCEDDIEPGNIIIIGENFISFVSTTDDIREEIEDDFDDDEHIAMFQVTEDGVWVFCGKASEVADTFIYEDEL